MYKEEEEKAQSAPEQQPSSRVARVTVTDTCRRYRVRILSRRGSRSEVSVRIQKVHISARTAPWIRLTIPSSSPPPPALSHRTDRIPILQAAHCTHRACARVLPERFPSCPPCLPFARLASIAPTTSPRRAGYCLWGSAPVLSSWPFSSAASSSAPCSATNGPAPLQDVKPGGYQ